MEETTIELDFLSQATFDLTASAKEFRDPFEGFFPKIPEMPPTAGIVYRIDEGLSTFCIRGIPCTNLFELSKEIENEDPSLLQKLKVESAPLEGLYFYETGSLELAEVVVDQMMNRRFPLEEDLLCNLSDPGFSWWMNLLPDGFDIYFSSHGLGRAERFVRLGPMGDRSIASHRLNSAAGLLRQSFPVREMYCDEKVFSVRPVGTDHLNFQILKNIFLKGENPTKEEGFKGFESGRTLYYFFKEVGVLRKFWLEIETKLQKKSDIPF
jgi:hypothetical protein